MAKGHRRCKDVLLSSCASWPITSMQRAGGAMVNWIEDIARWDGSLPAALVAIDLEQRDMALRALVARVLDLHPNAVTIERVKGRPPVLLQAAGHGLHLSTSSRGPFAAMAVAKSRVGI